MAHFKRLQTISFLVLLFLVFVLIFQILKPFVNIIALGLILAILFRPLYLWLRSRVKYENLAAGISVLIILLIFLIPIWFFGQVIFNEVGNLYQRYRDGGFIIDKGQIISSLPPQLQTIVQNLSVDINSYIGKLSSQAFSSVTSIFTNIVGFIVAAFMMFFIVFYLLRDGTKIKKAFMDVSPISTTHEDKLFDRIVSAVNGVVKGSFLMALIQGFVATVGLFIFGLPEPFLWGAFTVVAALVPTVGTSISMIPAIIYLLITGHIPQAIGMTIWAAFAVGLIDNFVGPRIVSSRIKLHPVLVLLAVVGGLKFFGALGFLIGPIIMAIFMELVDLYRSDFKDSLSS